MFGYVLIIFVRGYIALKLIVIKHTCKVWSDYILFCASFAAKYTGKNLNGKMNMLTIIVAKTKF